MARVFYSSFSPLFILVLFIPVCIRCGAVEEDRKVYIVYMGALPEGEYSPTSHHLSMLEEVLEDGSIADNFVRSYKRSFNGFAAKLNEKERQKLASKEGVVSVFLSRNLQLQTTRSWDFMGFSENVKRNHRGESDVIVGVIDTGIWPESESFNDEGFGVAPKKWKGVCAGQNFSCNNKLIGAQVYSYPEVITSARDIHGHGTHSASIIAGNLVSGVDFYGLAHGNGRGGVPSARIAAYKVCGNKYSGCAGAFILAAFDDAITDGVDIISISLVGRDVVPPFDKDPVAIGAFHAMKKGILTSHSAGNEGPSKQTILSVAPWLLSVAASNTDRHIINKVVLGDGTVLEGNGINTFTLNGTNHPLMYGNETTKTCDERSARYCAPDCFDATLVKGKIVLCDGTYGYVADVDKALGTIRSDDIEDVTNDYSFVSPFAATELSNKNGDLVRSYWNSTKNPQAIFLKSEVVNDSFAPRVVSISSRGPNKITPDILKPDITAPGVEILAAYSPLASPSQMIYFDKRSVKYSIYSGTSASCAHATGAAAYVKSFHPDWSGSAIKSALMTTAWSMNSTRNPDAEFAYGAGHIDPVKAVDPGLVYEILTDDYIKFLCNIGWDIERIRIISGDNSTTCPRTSKGATVDLNYPSLTAHLSPKTPFVINFPRKVKNVGSANSTYKASFISDSKIKISVKPEVLSFKSLNQEISFVVTVSGSGFPQDSMVSASLVWSDGTHNVRSPIVVHSFDNGS